MHGLIQLPALLKLPERKYTFTLGLHLPDVREVARLMGPRVLGVAFVQLNFLINTRLASLMPLGSVTAIAVGFFIDDDPRSRCCPGDRHRRPAEFFNAGGQRQA
jgi:putative peptidoglycan lipid II flippase